MDTPRAAGTIFCPGTRCLKETAVGDFLVSTIEIDLGQLFAGVTDWSEHACDYQTVIFGPADESRWPIAAPLATSSERFTRPIPHNTKQEAIVHHEECVAMLKRYVVN